MTLLTILAAQGEPDTWPKAVAYVGLGICATVAYAIYRRTDKDSDKNP